MKIRSKLIFIYITNQWGIQSLTRSGNFRCFSTSLCLSWPSCSQQLNLANSNSEISPIFFLTDKGLAQVSPSLACTISIRFLSGLQVCGVICLSLISTPITSLHHRHKPTTTQTDRQLTGGDVLIQILHYL